MLGVPSDVLSEFYYKNIEKNHWIVYIYAIIWDLKMARLVLPVGRVHILFPGTVPSASCTNFPDLSYDFEGL